MTQTLFELEQGFEDYLNEVELVGTRRERFYEDAEAGSRSLMIRWLRAAYQQGARDMANATLNTLDALSDSEYGPNEYCTQACLDKAQDDLAVYYQSVFRRT